MTPRIPVKALRNPIHLFSLGFGSGLLPKMPGTWGTVAAIPFYLFLQYLSPFHYGIMLVLTFLVGIWFCHYTEKTFGLPDHPRIVWDEMVGYWCTMFLMPNNWMFILLGFLLFRFFDIAKPWPISYFNRRVKGGFGIMLDDVLAAVPAWCILLVLSYFLD